MGNVIIISNRLPVTVIKNSDGKLEYTESIGGLSTGLKGIHEQANSLWVGWPGISNEQITEEEREEIYHTLIKKYKCLPVFLSEEEINLYYHGFCNKTIWPLFHYFQAKTEYNFTTWDAYKEVNIKFLTTLEGIVESDDVIWIHDYHLFLLPEMVRNRYKNAHIGFFLHIPFPSVEIFRLLIWRNEIISGILGADLIGFHTYDYVRHFLSCTRRLLGLEDNLNKIAYEDRYVQVNAFPMGIDYEQFFQYQGYETFNDEKAGSYKNAEGMKIILSIDRLDYTKGIPQRIKALERLFERFPEFIGRVVMNLIVAPSRTEVDSYGELLKEINEKISEVNGKYGTMDWMPIWFFYRSYNQRTLIDFYRQADVMLVTPLRDGMNLIAKEYIASRNDYGGMIVISETAGAATELGEAIIVNANDYYSTALGIKLALDMPIEEKIMRNKMMHRRLKRYNVNFWSAEFLESLNQTVIETKNINIQKSGEDNIETIKADFEKAKKRILFLDYDGTLVGFTAMPEQAKPDEELKKLLEKLSSNPKNTVVIVSGRDRNILWEWLGTLDISILASHGLWLKRPNQEDWTMIVPLNNDWKNSVRPIIERYTDSMPGSFIEEKEFSIAWHYRLCNPEMVAMRLHEIKDTIYSMTQCGTLGIQEGNKVLEIKDNRFNKGYGASQFLQNQEYDFIFGVGDDYTDEDLFSSFPQNSYTIRVGSGNTNATYRMKTWKSVRQILEEFANC